MKILQDERHQTAKLIKKNKIIDTFSLSLTSAPAPCAISPIQIVADAVTSTVFSRRVVAVSLSVMLTLSAASWPWGPSTPSSINYNKKATIFISSNLAGDLKDYFQPYSRHFTAWLHMHICTRCLHQCIGKLIHVNSKIFLIYQLIFIKIC